MKFVKSVSVPRPLYIVVCDLPGAMTRAAQPLLMVDEDEAPEFAGLFDDELLPALIGIRYALHLPKTRFETLDLPLLGVNDAQSDPRKQLVLLAPTEFLAQDDRLKLLQQMYDLVLIICPPSRLSFVAGVGRQFDFALEPIAFDALSQESLDRHWSDLARRWSKEWPPGFVVDSAAPRWISGSYSGGSDVSLKRLAKLLGDPSFEPTHHTDGSDGALELLSLKTRLLALIALEEGGVTLAQAASQLPPTMQELAPSMRARLSVSLPGVAPRYRKKMTSQATQIAAETWSGPPDVLSLLVSHDATATESMGVLHAPVPDDAFHALAALEKHWIDGAKPAKVKALLNKLNAAASDIWTGSFSTVVARATSIHAFTNFPLGLLTLPGDSAPLATRTPIAYRAVNPLTRALQMELSPDPDINLQGELRVLIAECIPGSDPVGAASRAAWTFAEAELSSQRIEVELRETLTHDELRAAVVDYKPSVLVISAHGFQETDKNVAGLMIGDEPAIGLELGDMPALVILSACHTGPRGGGVVAVSDMIIASGATAVLSTLVPVDVFHNSTFMVRFLLYLALAAEGSEGETNVLDVWHRVQSNSVIIDIVYGNKPLREWAHQRENGESPLEEFMSRASRGRIRLGHTYADAEAVLGEIADRRGMGEKVRAWLSSPGYLPEAIMYTLVGYPESIQLRDRPLT